MTDLSMGKPLQVCHESHMYLYYIYFNIYIYMQAEILG